MTFPRTTLTATHTGTATEETTRTHLLPPYNVILLNDDHHSFDFVVQTLCKVLGCNVERAFVLTRTAHEQERAIIWSGPKEVAELKAEQVHTCHEIRENGRDLGPLGCTIEPAPGS